MGSKNRIGNKLRQSARFKALEAELERLDLPFTVHAPTHLLIIPIPSGVNTDSG